MSDFLFVKRSSKVPALSIIIPAYNEAEFLPILFKSLQEQTFQNFEVIVADAHSKDNTRVIARKLGAKVVDGGLPGVGRNYGAKIARANTFLFLDADITLPPDFIEKNLREFKRRKLVCASSWMKPISKNIVDKFLFFSTNISVVFLNPFNTRTYGCCIFVKRKTFEKINGFDETLYVGEDNDFGHRARKTGKYGFFSVSRVHVSVRRLEKEGRFKSSWNIVKIAFYDITGKKVTSKNQLNYDFSGFEKKKK